ncbi:NADH dehydrogenase [ubiquinone] 1 alpha subcomplex assembly factor 3 [Caenorhabditis elegans]|uniref:NADH dehydrogenase [ubiquinone] 1 alpha subcomplex assembly factor 3 n=2 Tax=Caenorhabditis elegans TaxID=6239 RepID=Q93931_CAEEL|nr:NADH dehydrogenase [ubiquinone] 1 alpha subcomplex assembly factor 3 [Caenorhabditis elegans]CAB03226.2 NADH dehydrogenase [ubiquinone] 1 alpha subcomplex assembly factor 3 [Caenorhabditis elegans]|eukprot:NP_001023328.1 NADH:Ubiquinone oxidoreductase Assembly Factor [Caenorhabditis elegans]
MNKSLIALGAQTARRFLSSSSKNTIGGGDANRADTGVLDGYHINPLEESDMTDRSRISMLSTEMLEAKQIGVRGLSCYGFRLLDGTFLYGPIALFPKTALSWRVPTPEDITPRSLALFAALEPKIDILVLGVGDKKNIDKVRASVAPFLREHKIGLEIMDTEDAIATFNFLNAEGRYVGAALYPPDDMVVTDKEYGRALALLKGWDTVEENPLLTGLSDTINGAEDLVKRLWSGDEKSWQSARQKVLESPSEREERMQQEMNDKEKKRIE